MLFTNVGLLWSMLRNAVVAGVKAATSEAKTTLSEAKKQPKNPL